MGEGSPVRPKTGKAPRTKSPHCCGVLTTVPLAQALFQLEPSVVAKQANGTPVNDPLPQEGA